MAMDTSSKKKPPPSGPKSDNFVVGLPPEGCTIEGVLGRYFAATSYIEFALITCLSAALGHGTNFDTAATIFGSIMSVSTKIDILEGVAKQSKLDNYRKNVIAAACDTLRKVNSRRNAYAHGVFEHNKAGKVRLTSWALQSNRKSSPEILSEAGIKGDIFGLEFLLHMALFISGVNTREQFQPWIDKFQSIRVRGSHGM
ncbi:MAG TPA: hypothetical protein VHD95_10765 [Rhizomicrobium sp.]|jgi:hypothetical protein|nr:hypothetical protein [Rhizomicrobium sp.]